MDTIHINEFCEKVALLNSTKNNVDFINGYNECKVTMENIDKFLEESETDNAHANMLLDELLELLKDYEEDIESGKDFTIKQFKEMQQIVLLVEKKMNESTMKIVEISDNF
jgi:hypothetical protein